MSGWLANIVNFHSSGCPTWNSRSFPPVVVIVPPCQQSAWNNSSGEDLQQNQSAWWNGFNILTTCSKVIVHSLLNSYQENSPALKSYVITWWHTLKSLLITFPDDIITGMIISRHIATQLNYRTAVPAWSDFSAISLFPEVYHAHGISKASF